MFRILVVEVDKVVAVPLYLQKFFELNYVECYHAVIDENAVLPVEVVGVDFVEIDMIDVNAVLPVDVVVDVDFAEVDVNDI